MAPENNDQKPLKVLHVVTVMDCGGAETRLMELMRHIDREKVQFDFCVHKDRKGYFNDEVRALGGKIVNCGPLKNLPMFCLRFYRMLKLSDYDVVHSHVPTFSAVCMTLAKWAGVKKRIAHFRNVHEAQKNTLVTKLIKKTVLKNATDIIGITKDLLRTWFGQDWKKNPKMHLVYNGIDTKPFENPPEPEQLKAEFNIPADHKIIVHVGRFHPLKNHVKIVSIAQAFLAENDKACFLLVGDGRLKEQIADLVKSKGLDSKFRFVGVRDDIARIMKASDVLLFPSIWEGLPGVILEAIAAGLPIVASKLAPIIEVLEICGSAQLVPVEAPDEQWAKALSKVSEMPHQTQWLKEIEASPFNIENAWQSLVKIYL
jgi:glycosyltransferase involved in cell wall biosynthesis